VKEQVITPRAGRGGGRSRSGGIVQRPAKRDRAAGAQSRAAHSGLRKFLAYLPLITRCVLAVVAGVLLFAGYRAAARASFFQVRNVDVSGTSRISQDEVKAIVKRAAQPAGVWQVDLEALSHELERMTWVRRAVVSRVLPDGLRVRITERQQRAVVRTSEGRLVWADDDAVMLGAFQSSDKMPPFFIRGWDESGTAQARNENRSRMEKYVEMLAAWEKFGLTQRVSEVNLGDLNDVRVQLAGDDAQIEVLVGKELFGERLRAALKELDEERNTARGPFITRIDAARWMKGGDSVVVGLDPTAPSLVRQSAAADSAADSKEKTADTVLVSRRSAETKKKPEEDKKRAEGDSARARRDAEKKSAKKETDKKERAAGDEKGQSRPRRAT
jgi:hypothetical protein